MHICLFAPWVRPGGGLTAVNQILDALGSTPGVSVTAVLDAHDTRRGAAGVVNRHEGVRVAPLVPGAPSSARFLLAKVLAPLRTRRTDLVLSINYWVPVSRPLVVYHLNLLNFVPPDRDSLPWKLRRLDARLACRRAGRNLFESEYVRAAARRAVANVQGEDLLYLGIRSEFASRIGTPSAPVPGRIALVTSPLSYKRNDLAFATLARVAADHPDYDWELRVIGGSPRDAGWAGVVAAAESAGVANRVTFVGRLGAHALAAELATARTLIAPSEIESFYMVAVEAMACGCQVVVQDVTSARESVGDGAFICPPGDVGLLAAALHTAEFDRAGGQERVRAGFEWARRFTPGRFRVDLLDAIGA